MCTMNYMCMQIAFFIVPFSFFELTLLSLKHYFHKTIATSNLTLVLRSLSDVTRRSGKGDEEVCTKVCQVDDVPLGGCGEGFT